MSSRFDLIFLLFFVLPIFVAAVETNITGKLYPYYQSGVQKNLNVSGLGLDIRMQNKLSSSVRTQIDVMGENDFEKTNESIGELLNAYMEWRPLNTKVRLGWQTIEWEGTDVLNLFDVVNSKNYTRPLGPILRSSPTLRIIKEVGPWELDLIYIPLKSSNRYPSNKSYWLPRGKNIRLESENTDVVIPGDIYYELKSSTIINTADKNNAGARLSFHGASLDASLFYFDGANTSATLILDGVPLEVFPKTALLLNSPIVITPIEYRQKTVGGLITKPLLNTWIFRFSLASTKPSVTDERTQGPQDAAVVSFENSTEVLSKPIILSLGVYEIRRPETNQLALLRSVFTKAFSFSGRLEFSDESSWLWALIYDSIGKSNLLHAEWDYRLSGQVTTGLSFDQFSGPKETLLGSYDNFDFYRLLVKYSF